MGVFSVSKTLCQALVLSTAVIVLAACGGSGSSAPQPSPTSPPPPPLLNSALDTKSEAAQFLTMAGLGASVSDIDTATGTNAADWVRAELPKPVFGYEAFMRSRLTDDEVTRRHSSQVMYEAMITSDAQLRARMTYALSQFFVVSNNNFNDSVRYGLGSYLDILDRNAFGNFRTLLEEVTYSPIMGDYLTYSYNRKGDPSKGRQPDENYAREVLQLFSIGLVELNMDGTPKRDGSGNEIETYSNDDVVGLARVFTGLGHQNSDFRRGRRGDDAYEVPLEMFDEQHSPLEKTFLGTTIPAGTPGDASIAQALDTIFAHPNVAPFFSRQLIQRFTASHPEPAYVQRVATAFETGRYVAEDGSVFGTSQRGDLSATIAAVLLDPTLFDNARGATEGKLREPVLKFVQFARTYAKPASTPIMLAQSGRYGDTSSPTDGLAQTPLKSPSVFNFYRPGYIAPSTETGDAGLTAPELQIVNQASVIGYLNFMSDFIIQGDTTQPGRLVPDLSEELAVGDDTQALLDLLDLKLLSGRMTATTRSAIAEAIDALPIRTGGSRDTDIRSRVRIAMLMTIGSAEYAALN